jgi:hypothetical protein
VILYCKFSLCCGYCATWQGSLDWLEVDLSACPASSFIQSDWCVWWFYTASLVSSWFWRFSFSDKWEFLPDRLRIKSTFFNRMWGNFSKINSLLKVLSKINAELTFENFYPTGRAWNRDPSLKYCLCVPPRCLHVCMYIHMCMYVYSYVCMYMYA